MCAGSQTCWFWGADSGDACHYANVHDRMSARVHRFRWEADNCDDGEAAVAVVETYEPNAFGLYDMIGNVFEWCEDTYGRYAYTRPNGPNPVDVSEANCKVLRGGSWFDTPRNARCGCRMYGPANHRAANVGFRLVMIPSSSDSAAMADSP